MRIKLMGQIWKPALLPNTSFNFKDVMCQNVCTGNSDQNPPRNNSNIH